jgi:hypothetical protein
VTGEGPKSPVRGDTFIEFVMKKITSPGGAARLGINVSPLWGLFLGVTFFYKRAAPPGLKKQGYFE